MKRFILPGAYVTNTITGKSGRVITVDRRKGTAIVKDGNHFWSAKTQQLEVTSYKGVE